MYVIGTSGFEALNGNPCMFSMRWLFLLKSGVETSENKAGLEQSGAGHKHSMDNSHWFYRGRVGKLITPGPNEPSGFIMTTILGIVGAIVASYLGQALGWYSAGEGAGLIGATVGAVIVLLVWGAIASRRTRVP